MTNKVYSNIKPGDGKIALSLEGGGARGAYQIGAVKALFENGYKFDAIVGTSIGAINGAYIAQGDFDKIYSMWQTMSFKDLFDLDNEVMKRTFDINLDINSIKYLSKKLGEALKNKGMDTEKMRQILEEGIDEEKIRKSDILYGLVTMCLSDINGEEKYIDEIPEGKLVDYILASANLPVFKRSIINNKKYLDGGAWDNCPVHMLEEKGYNKVIAIRAHKRIRIRDYKNIVKRGNILINMIEPIDTLPSILNFDTNNLNYELKLGYYDGLRYINNYDGFRYYFSDVSNDYIIQKLNSISPLYLEKLARKLKIKLIKSENIFDLLTKKIIPELVLKTKEKNVESLKDSIIAILEQVLKDGKIDKFKIYSFEDAVSLTDDKLCENDILKEFILQLK